jgi:esterase/lipase
VFLIHGYTGTPHDFNELPKFLHDVLNVRVRVMVLPGHGTSIRDLDRLSYDDFFRAAEKTFNEESARGIPVIVGGISFGALLALDLASRHTVLGVINTNPPMSFRFPFCVHGVGVLQFYKKYWVKHFRSEELMLRERTFFFKEMHIKGLSLIRRARKAVQRAAFAILCPVLTIHSVYDPIGGVRGVRRLKRLLINARHDVVTYRNKNHNVFYSENRDVAYRRIASFVEDALEPNVSVEKSKVAALVPAYNEAARIVPVLDALLGTPEINEVIVIDDASTDGTADAARSRASVHVIVNERNLGKSGSLERGIESTDANILFFCDADLRGFTPKVASAIISPVKSGHTDMFIGTRNNVTQKALTLFALNSGERALRRELWDALPRTMKHRYRLEVGLNIIASLAGRRYGWKRFEYYQTLKEVKYGFWRGTILRWRMNIDVLYAYALGVLLIITTRAGKARTDLP